MAPPTAFPGTLTVDVLAGGMTVALLDNPQAPVVGVSLWVRAGTRDDPPGHGGLAHFLEHLMFQGSRRFAPGEHDRRIQALGGDDEAVTGHDATAFTTRVAAEHWRRVLELEADRIAHPRIDPEAVGRERRVILAELAMYEDDPWDGLAREVDAALYGAHPYARPILGTREQLEATGADQLRAFHRRHYHPANTVLAISGRLAGREPVLAAAGELFAAATPARPPAPPRTPTPPRPGLPGTPRVVRRHPGDAARLLLALPAPAADHPDHPALHLLTVLLARGRGSRLMRSLVEEEDAPCSAVSASVSAGIDPGAFIVAAETLPGVSPERVEETIHAVLDDLARTPPAAEEVERARETALAGWVFEHQRIADQAIALGAELTLHSPGWLRRRLEAIARLTPAELTQAAARHLAADRGAGGVVGWSLPERSRR